MKMNPTGWILGRDIKAMNQQMAPSGLCPLADQLGGDRIDSRGFRHPGVGVLALRKPSGFREVKLEQRRHPDAIRLRHRERSVRIGEDQGLWVGSACRS